MTDQRWHDLILVMLGWIATQTTIIAVCVFWLVLSVEAR